MIVTRLDPTDGVSEQFPTRMATFLFSGRKSWDFLQGSSIVASESLQACYEARKHVGVKWCFVFGRAKGFDRFCCGSPLRGTVPKRVVKRISGVCRAAIETRINSR